MIKRNRFLITFLLAAWMLGVFAGVAQAAPTSTGSTALMVDNINAGQMTFSFENDQLSFNVTTNNNWKIKSLSIRPNLLGSTEFYRENFAPTTQKSAVVSNLTYNHVKSMVISAEMEINNGQNDIVHDFSSNAGANVAAVEAPLNNSWLNYTWSGDQTTQATLNASFPSQAVTSVLRYNSNNNGNEVWIWNTANTSANYQVGESIIMQGSFTLPNDAQIQNVYLALAADDAAYMNVGGTDYIPMGVQKKTDGLPEINNSFVRERAYMFDITSAVRVGSNNFSIYARNDAAPNASSYKDNPAGVVYRIIAKYRSNSATRTAQVSATANMQDSGSGFGTIGHLQTITWVSAINGINTNFAGSETNLQNITVRSGETLTVHVQVTNKGNIALLPAEIAVIVPDALEFNGAQNPTWNLRSTGNINRACYTDVRNLIQPGQSIGVDVTLRVRDGINRVDATLVAELPRIVDASNMVVNNDINAKNYPATLYINSIVSPAINTPGNTYGPVAPTGDSASSLLPIAVGFGLMTIVSIGLVVTHRMKKR